MAGSPAIDAGNPAAPGSADGACSATDERGIGRPQGARCDIGAFEFEPPPTTSTTTLPTTSQPTTTTVTVPAASTTSTTRPPAAEVCGDCVDNDGNGLTDLEDPACCNAAAPLTLRALRLAEKKSGGIRLDLGGTLPGSAIGAGMQTGDVVFLQMQADGAPDFLCARIPAARFVRHGKKLSFVDHTHEVASARGLDALKLREKKTGLALRVAGGGLGISLPSAGTVHLTVGLHDPATTEAGHRCAAVAARLAAKKGGLTLP